jgi:hypothetical protein
MISPLVPLHGEFILLSTDMLRFIFRHNFMFFANCFWGVGFARWPRAARILAARGGRAKLTSETNSRKIEI